MRWLITLAASLVIFTVYGTELRAQGRMYAISGAGSRTPSEGTLFELNANDGSIVQTIGPMGINNTTGLAINRNGEAFVVENGVYYSGENNLYSLDLNTGATTLIGPTNQQIPDISFANDGTLFGWSESGDELVTIDTAAGAATVVPGTHSGSARTGLAVDANGVIHMKTSNTVRVIDPMAGPGPSVALSGDTSSTHNILAVDSNGVAYTAKRLGTGRGTEIYTIDLETGVTTLLGTVPIDSLSAIAFLYNVAPAKFAELARTFNESEVAAALDSFQGDPNSELGQFIDTLRGLSPGDQQAALNSLNSEIYGSLTTLMVQATTQQNRRLVNRLRNAGGQGGGAFGSNAPAGSTDTAIASFTPGDDLIVRGQGGRLRHQTNTWGLGYGYAGQIEGDGNASALDFSTGGAQFGMETYTTCDTLLGWYADIGGGYANAAAPRQDVDIANYRFGGYGRGDALIGYWLGSVGLGFSDFQSSRSIAPGVVARGDFDGFQGSAYFERGVNFCYGRWQVTPFASAQYVGVHQSAFSETGAGALGLNVDDVDEHSLRSFVGAQARTSYCTPIGCFTPEVRAEWVHEFLSDTTVVNSRFNGVGSPSFAAAGVNAGSDFAFLGVGASLARTCNSRLFASYDVQVNNRSVFHIGTAGVELAW